jgi:hypothetical protein
MRGLAVVCALGLALVAARAGDSPARTTCHPSGSGAPTQRIHYANLDRDGFLERIIETVGGCPHQSVVALEDRCGRATRVHALPGVGDLARLDVLEANGREDGKELLFGFRARKPTARYRGNVGLVHFAPIAVGRCPRPVYVLSHFVRRPPRGAGELVRLALLRWAPREVRLHESFRRGALRETRFRYVPREDRYVLDGVTTTRV